MSTLHITFAILGVAVILAVIVYNLWYNARYAPRKAREAVADATPQSDVRREPALDGSAQALDAPEGLREPGWVDGQGPGPDAAKPTGLFGQGRRVKSKAAQVGQSGAQALAGQAEEGALESGAPSSASGSEPGSAAAVPAPADPPSQEFDSLVFSVAPLALDKPVSGEAALAALPPTHRIGKKQFLVQGLNIQTRQWEAPHAGSRYSEFQAAIQLANRQGALNELEFSEFVLKTQDFADAIGAEPDFPDMLHEVARGREVDGFAAANDAVLNLMLVAQRATWSPGYINQCAARHGFKPSLTPGRLVLPAVQPHMPPVLALSYDSQAAMADDLDHTPINEILFTLDVPNVDRAENAFERLRHILGELAETMEGNITDPDGRKLPAMAIESIGADLNQLYEALEARGFPAGSPSALKLFS
ncbi:cell division protein FtsZ [Allofranklinella schreckenbergeri]|uniref:Cell division protein FtsZ n=1 Tax=Allofranklinella schreckenbergeri TaxID=1076744 RepID=A0A3M6QWZ4_9BURK|nr:cell division protein FtsZ [Allofranklinella schreckenbergeri]RMX07503.1 cell division protein FtsZ [Allofranklinella schreckenbergeri]